MGIAQRGKPTCFHDFFHWVFTNGPPGSLWRLTLCSCLPRHIASTCSVHQTVPCEKTLAATEPDLSSACGNTYNIGIPYVYNINMYHQDGSKCPSQPVCSTQPESRNSFAAIRGIRLHGINEIPQGVQQGARPQPCAALHDPVATVAPVRVPHSAKRMAKTSPSDAWHGDVLSLANHSCNLPGNCCTCLLATPISNPSGGMQVITKIGGFVIEHIKNTWNQLPIDPIPSRWPQAPPSVVQSLTISASKTWAADLQGFNSLRVWGNLGNCMKLPKFPLNNRILDFWGSTPLKFCV